MRTRLVGEHGPASSTHGVATGVKAVHRFKPDLEAYRYAAAHLGVQPGEILLTAAHAWDVFGAMKAGWQAAFVARNGIPLFPLGPKPDIIGPDMKAVTDAILS